MSRQYITTAIDYPNAAPHMGHVLEKVLADVCARWFRLRGDEVRFQTGTDEHGIKIQRKAEEEGLTPQQLVDRNVPLFRELYDKLQISYDVFVRTTDQQHHWPTVQELWKKLRDAGVLEKRTYTGLYCAGCERFVTAKDLIDGKCAIHQKAPEEVSEENWFFRLKDHEEFLKSLLTRDDGYRIIPSFRAKETLSILEQGLEDVSFSRPRSSLEWGIPVPDDDNQVMYVWCDALTNYISTLGYFTSSEDRTFWDDAIVTHVIGKDIARFHALIWPAMLKTADAKTPDQLLIHGFLTSEGEKKSKSLGNVVHPHEALEKYGVDALRFYLSHEIPVGNDGDFSWKRFGELYDAKLRNQLGNLLNRVMVMLNKNTEPFAVASQPIGMFDVIWQQYERSMNAFEVHAALALVFEFVTNLNQTFNDIAPWKEESSVQAATLASFAEGLRHLSLMLLPFMPETAQKIAKQLNVPYADQMLEKNFVITSDMKKWGSQTAWQAVGTPEILFPQILS
jgi:methionyl-tRNA synthetase